jgi:hypothetical protein
MNGPAADIYFFSNTGLVSRTRMRPNAGYFPDTRLPT